MFYGSLTDAGVYDISGGTGGLGGAGGLGAPFGEIGTGADGGAGINGTDGTDGFLVQRQVFGASSIGTLEDFTLTVIRKNP